MNKQKIIQDLGIIAKAQGMVWGKKLFDQIKTQKILLVIVATDMGASQKKKLLNQCQYYQILVSSIQLTKQELAHACGKKELVAIGITDWNLFQLIKKYN